MIALEIIRRTHKAHITDRGAENPTGPKLPDFILIKCLKNSEVTAERISVCNVI